MKQIVELFEKWACEPHVDIQQLPLSGSQRTYYRINSKTKTALGAYNKDKKENFAFIQFSRFFKEKNMPVPHIYAFDDNQDCYLLQDLGNTTLFQWLSTSRNKNIIPDDIISFYKSVIQWLIKFQIVGKCIDLSATYPRAKFDKQSMMWDLQYFKYYFLKLGQISFDEQLLENDFELFTDYLLETDTDYFLYRDFQSRNIMVVENKPFFIDYQGGRMGALQYDIASLLYDAKADLPPEIRCELLDYYIAELQKKINIDEAKFKKYYYGYVLIRIMQAMGAYGFRGFYEKKEHFLKSIPFALKNLESILNNHFFINEFSELKNVLSGVISSKFLKEIENHTELCVSIKSFSYKRGIPADTSKHGGGFVFDCRLLPNPGRNVEYKTQTGKDKEVKEYFEKEQEVKAFLGNVFTIISQAVEKYLKNGYNSLSVNFGCTGGRHRSVYSAEQLAEFLRKKYAIRIKINHIEMEIVESVR